MAQRATNTMAEGLQRLIADISQMKLSPDADIAFLTGLETQVIGYLRAPLEAMNGQLPGPSGPPGGGMGGDMAGAMGGQMAGPMAGMPGGTIPGPGGMPPPVPVGARGTRTSPHMPNPDEVRRMLQAG